MIGEEEVIQHVERAGPTAPARTRMVVDILERSLTLDERLPHVGASRSEPPHDGAVEARLRRWADILTDGNVHGSARRIQWMDLHPDRLRRGFATFHLPAHAPLPRWAAVLDEALDVVGRWRDQDVALAVLRQDPALDAENRVPFEESLLPFLQIGRTQLERALPGIGAILSASAHRDLERGLLARLGALADQTLFRRFSDFRARSGKGSYDAFVGELTRGGLIGLLQEYPVLARRLAACTSSWVTCSRDLIQRLDADRAVLGEVLGKGHPIGQVSRIEPNLSDPHHGAQMVAILHFDSGLRVVYKPRSLGMEAAFYDLVKWLNAHADGPTLRVLEVIDAGSYGWVEHVSYEACASLDEVASFYQRAGMLLALAYVLGGADFHSENVVASGAHPVLIDLEVLLCSPAVQHAPQSPAPGGAPVGTVLHTALLPFRTTGAGGAGVFGGGLAPGDPTPTQKRRVWRHPNTDLMRSIEVWPAPGRVDNVPTWKDVVTDVSDYRGDLERGFRIMYDRVLALRSMLLSPSSPLERFRAQRWRYVYRNTATYGSLLKRMTHPRFLADGVAYGTELEVLKRLALRQTAPSWDWPLLLAEAPALVDGDVPIFHVPCDGTDVFTGSGRILENCFVESGYDAVRSRLERLSQEDAQHQAEIIRMTLTANRLKRHRHSRERTPSRADEPLAAGELLEEAISIAETLEAVARPGSGDDSLTWFGAVDTVGVAGATMGGVGNGLYAGQGGIAVFLAALARATGNPRHRALAWRALRPLVRSLEGDGLRALIATEGLGANAGTGAFLYALARFGEWLAAPEVLATAERLAAAVTRNDIRADDKLELLFGTSGHLLGLLALHSVRPQPWLLERADWCGRHLLESRVVTPSGARAWVTMGGQVTTGVPHGSAGIAHALCALYRVTGVPAFRTAVVEAHAFERSLFVPELNNWREHADAPESALPAMYCHGATGIGLARLAGLDVVDSEDVRADIHAAVGATRDAFEAGWSGVDHACCGTLGRAELLMRAGAALGRPDLHDLAVGGVAYLLRRAQAFGGYRLGYDDILRPGAFQGLAGIGAALLRFRTRGEVPFVPLLE